jgi:protein-S-isoprenylcysteine O-methyltransferase Ste14
MMDGFLLTLWCVPTMTLGHLQFALLMTAYILVGVHMEERGLFRRLGEDYRQYCQDTPMLIPVPLRWRFWKTNVGKPLATGGRPA